MQNLKRIFDFYIFSNIHVAFAVFSLTKITLLTYSIDNNLVPWFVFFSTIVSYNFIRLYTILEIQDWSFQFIKQYKKSIFSLTFISLGIVVYLSFLLKFSTLITLIPFALFTLFYVLPFPIKNTGSLRNIAFLKLFLIAISWAGITVLVPLINYNIDLNSVEIIIFIQRFLFVLVITIPFDIRDMNFDSSNLKTLPQVIGIYKSKIYGLICLFFFLGLELLKSPSEVTALRNHFIIAVITLLFLFRASANQNKYFSAFFVESIPIVWLLIYLYLH